MDTENEEFLNEFLEAAGVLGWSLDSATEVGSATEHAPITVTVFVASMPELLKHQDRSTRLPNGRRASIVYKLRR